MKLIASRRRQLTSEKVSEAVLCFFLLANIIAETASLELVAKGRAIKEMKKVGIPVASEKLSTASTRGSANAPATIVPKTSSNTAFRVVNLGFSTPPVTSSVSSPDFN